MKFNDLSKLSDAEIEANKETILIWSIVFLFLCQLSGILGLVYYISLNNDSSSTVALIPGTVIISLLNNS